MVCGSWFHLKLFCLTWMVFSHPWDPSWYFLLHPFLPPLAGGEQAGRDHEQEGHEAGPQEEGQHGRPAQEGEGEPQAAAGAQPGEGEVQPHGHQIPEGAERVAGGKHHSLSFEDPDATEHSSTTVHFTRASKTTYLFVRLDSVGCTHHLKEIVIESFCRSF